MGIRTYVEDIASRIDISAVQAMSSPQELQQLVGLSDQYGFKVIHTLPCWMTTLRELIESRADVTIGGPVGFPAGGSTVKTKVSEAQQLLNDGAQQLDLVVNGGMIRAGRWEYIRDEIRAVCDVAGAAETRVILETAYMTDDEIRRGCEAVIVGGADYVKTGTGWAASTASMETIRLIVSLVKGEVEVKAAGGIRDLQTVLKMDELGVRRFGINGDAAARIMLQYASWSRG